MIYLGLRDRQTAKKEDFCFFCSSPIAIPSNVSVLTSTSFPMCVCVIFSREEVAVVAGIAKQKTPGKKNNF
jgi:hypothetical protein